jgi:hypothetical protein
LQSNGVTYKSIYKLINKPINEIYWFIDKFVGLYVNIKKLLFICCPLRCKATDQVTLPQLINEVDKQGREIRPLRVTLLPKSQSILLIGLPIN